MESMNGTWTRYASSSENRGSVCLLDDDALFSVTVSLSLLSLCLSCLSESVVFLSQTGLVRTYRKILRNKFNFKIDFH